MSAAPGPSRALGLLCILILALPVCWASTTVTEVTTLTEEANLQRLGGKSTEAQIQITSWTTGVLVFLVVLWALFGPKLGRFYLTEGSAACLLGLVCGLLLLAMRHYIVQQAVVQKLLAFSAASFFTYLLPPVIFYAGLSIEKTLFFSNLGSILALGVVGTAFAALLLAAFLAAGFAGLKVLRLQDCLALGAIFSATDSVATLQVLNPEKQPVLFSLVFGEGVINDATSVVLLGAVSTIFPQGAAAAAPLAGADGSEGAAAQGNGWDQMGSIALTFLYLFFTSLALGAATGMGISCLVVRFAAHGPHHEVALIGLLSYLSYLAAEVLGLSGILSLFCCGLTVSHFGLDGISPLGRTTTLNAFHTMSYICEGVIFIYLGMDALDPAKWNAARPGEAVTLCFALLLLLLIARAASVVPITALHNWLHSVKLSSTDIVIIWWSGLMRGAVSVALAYYYFDIGSPQGTTGDTHRSTLIAATLVVVLTSIMLLGALTPPLMQFLVDNPDLTLLEKLHKGYRLSQGHARGCMASLMSGVCCCLSGRNFRNRWKRSEDGARSGGVGAGGARISRGGNDDEAVALLSVSNGSANDANGRVGDGADGKGDVHGDMEMGKLGGGGGGVLGGGGRDRDSGPDEKPASMPSVGRVIAARRGDVGQRRGRSDIDAPPHRSRGSEWDAPPDMAGHTGHSKAASETSTPTVEQESQGLSSRHCFSADEGQGTPVAGRRGVAAPRVAGGRAAGAATDGGVTGGRGGGQQGAQAGSAAPLSGRQGQARPP